MIIFDFSQLVLSSVFTQPADMLENKHALSFSRHLVLNQLRNIKSTVSKKYKKPNSNIVLACDGQHYWRRQYYSFYKSHRKENREKSKYDFAKVFSILDTLLLEFKEHFPYRVLKVYESEADDVIATLAASYHTFEPIFIVSSDKDFKQLQKYSNVYQYNPFKKTWIVEKNPEDVLMEMIIRGDGGDGIPNLLSADNSLVDNIRQKPITVKVLKDIKEQTVFERETLTHWKRNKTLIDFDEIPAYIRDSIIKEYDSYDLSHGRSKLYGYFVSNQLNNLLDSIQDF